MRWQDFRRSENVEESQGGAPTGFGGGGFRLGGGALIIVVIVSLLLGKNPLEILSLLSDGGGGGPPAQTRSLSPAEVAQQGASGQQKDFVMAIVGDNEDVWKQIFAQSGRQYVPPKLDLFTGGTRSGCGIAQAAMGPFYCPNDRKVYLDLTFFQELAQRFGAPGEFARAYVIAHELGHDVQNQLGVMDRLKESGGPGRGEDSLSVKLELQADCFAGVWGHSAARRGALDTKDIEQGIAAAAGVGDDRLQRQSQGYVRPDAFSHGSSAQRVRWFRTGLQTGDPASCNTFNAREL